MTELAQTTSRYLVIIITLRKKFELSGKTIHKETKFNFKLDNIQCLKAVCLSGKYQADPLA